MKITKLAITISAIVILALAGAGSALAATSPGTAASPGATPAGAQTAQPVNNPANGIKVDIHHVLIQANNGETLQVQEVIKYDNTSKQAFSGDGKTGGREVLNISLPAGYSSLKVTGISQDSYIAKSDSLITTSPLNPGTTEISLAYDLPFTDGQIQFSKVINYPTDVFYVLSPKGQLRITGDSGIQDFGIQTMDSTQYHAFALSQAQPGNKFSLSISPDRVGQGYQEPGSGFHSASHLERWYSSPLANTNPHLWAAAIIILFFGAVAIIGHRIRKKQRNQRMQEEQERLAGLLDNLVVRQKRLLDTIDSLDTKHDSGEISSENYTDLRNQYVNKLVKIKLKIRELEAYEDGEGC